MTANFKFITNTFTGSPMSPEAQIIWDNIVEKNTLNIEKLMSMTKEERFNINCTFEDIPNPFINCT